jgi:hypothetical protein
VVENIEGVPSRFFDEASLSNLAVDVGPSSDWSIYPVVYCEIW